MSFSETLKVTGYVLVTGIQFLEEAEVFSSLTHADWVLKP
jgi:hypothetical protein